MKKLFKIAAVAIIVLLTAQFSYAQEWTKEQLEVWKVVQDSWAKWKASDVDGMTAILHEKYQGWSDRDPLPMGKSAVISWYREMKDAIKAGYYYIEPARISMTKTAAVVDYYYEYSATFTMGEKPETKNVKGKAAEFYVKEDGKWMLLGDLWTHDSEK